MPRVQRLDEGLADLRVLEETGVCERAPLQYRRNPDKSWPFLFSAKEGRILVNAARQTSRYESAKEVGEALL